MEKVLEKLAGNWQRFDSFSWWGRDNENVPDPERWALVYTVNRDSSPLERANAKAIDAELEQWTEGDTPDVIPERHTHWACGWVDGYAIRVFTPEGEPTPAILRYLELSNFLTNDYPVLDDTLYEKELEEDREETWRNCCLSEFVRALERHHGVEVIMDDTDALRSFCETAGDAIGEYWEEDSGRSYLNVERIAQSIDPWELVADGLAWSFRVRWIDVGESTEDYLHEEEASQRVLALRGQGFVGAVYDWVQEGKPNKATREVVA